MYMYIHTFTIYIIYIYITFFNSDLTEFLILEAMQWQWEHMIGRRHFGALGNQAAHPSVATAVGLRIVLAKVSPPPLAPKACLAAKLHWFQCLFSFRTWLAFVGNTNTRTMVDVLLASFPSLRAKKYHNPQGSMSPGPVLDHIKVK